MPAKISRPSSRGVFPRHRLFRLLDGLTDGPPLIWIAGPPGTGKTTLAASWLEARQIPLLWYQVDEGDSDPASFFYHLSLAAKRAAPRKRKPLPLLTPEYLQGIPAFSRRYFEELYARMLSAAGNSLPAAMVFDNCHEVTEESPFPAILYEGLSKVPSGIKVILISRKEPPEAFARLRANSLMKIVGWDELKFTLEESKEMVGIRDHGEFSPDCLQQLHAKTDGWAAGIVLLLESAGSSGMESVLSRVYAPKEIFQYFAGEIFERTAPETRDFLLKTSFFPRMSSKMAQALTGSHQAQRILSELNARNYFTQKLESGTDFYQYHPLFREFLQFVAAETFDLDGLQRMQKKAALLLEENGQPEDGIELLRKAEAWPDSVSHILRHAPDLAAQGRSQTLAGWIEGLPKEIVQADPWLLYWLGTCHTFSLPDQSYGLFEKAFDRFRAKRDVPGVFLALSGLFDSIIYGLSCFTNLERTIALFEDISNEFPCFPSPEIEARLTGSTVYAMFLAQPQHPDLERLAERSLSLLPVVSELELKVHMLQPLIWHYLFSGEFSKAEPLLDQLFRIVRIPSVYPLIQILLKNMKSFHSWLEAEFPESQKAAAEGLEIASSTGVHVVDPYLLGHASAAALNCGEMKTAEAFIEKMGCCVNLNIWAGSFYHLLSAWASFIKCDLSKALAQTELSLKLTEEAGVPITESYCLYGAALILHGLNKEREAADHLARCHSIARCAGAPIVKFMCLLAEAHFAFERGDESAGLAVLKEALCLGREKGYCSTVFWAPSMIAGLCQKALESGIEIDYVQHLIRKRNLMPDPPPVDCERWPWALRIYTLGRFEIVQDGKSVQFSGKVQKRPLHLLKVLISSGGSKVLEEHIADRLWPDAPGDAAHSSFTTALSRLRRLLGIEKAITVQDGKVSLDPRYCWVDALAFERILAQVDKGIGEQNGVVHPQSSEVLALAEKAFALYTGHFLPGDEGESWAISCRERLRSGFARLVSGIGDQLEKAGQWDKASECYRKALDIDDTSEEFYQRLMVCYRELGLYANAIEVYKRCEKVFAAKLGIEPSPKTEAIYKDITGATHNST